jgi:glycosyltransferase involved in cell wall biosynthesis
MKILNVISDITAKSGGPVTTMVHMNRLWLAGGHEVHVATIEGDGQTLPIDGNLIVFPSSFPSRFGCSNAMSLWLEENFSRFDIVFIHGVWTGVYMASANFLRKKRRPYVLIPHGSLDPFDVQKKSVLKRILGPLFLRPCIEGSAAILCSTEREANLLVTYGAECRRRVLPWPVPPPRSAMSRDEARKALRIPADEFVVLSLGRVNYKKGFPILLPAIRDLAQVNSKTRLLIVGPDSNGYTRVVQRMVNVLGIDRTVTFYPLVMGDDKLRLQAAADCFALPSLNENFGYTIVEAMQVGLPCVISNNVYICDELESAGAAIVCNYDSKEVFNALRKLSENPALRAQMSSNAARTAESFAPASLIERYLMMLTEFVAL